MTIADITNETPRLLFDVQDIGELVSFMLLAKTRVRQHVKF